MKKIILLSILYIKMAIPHPSSGYNIKDLEILKEQKAYKEFFAHILDIRPSNRDKHYNKLVQYMALSYLENKLIKADYKLKTFEFISYINTLSPLKKDEFFSIKRDKYLKKWLQHCLKNDRRNKICTNKIKDIYSINSSPDMGLYLAKLIKKYQLNINYLVYLKPLLVSPPDNSMCKKPIVIEAIIKSIENDNLEKISKNCFLISIDSLKNILTYKKYPIKVKQKLFYALAKKGFLNTYEKDLFLTLFILESPTPGPLFNNAWNNIKTLSEDYSRRQKILNVIKKIEPTPGKVLRSKNTETKRAIYNLFAKNFPEYIQYFKESK